MRTEVIEQKLSNSLGKGEIVQLIEENLIKQDMGTIKLVELT